MPARADAQAIPDVSPREFARPGANPWCGCGAGAAGVACVPEPLRRRALARDEERDGCDLLETVRLRNVAELVRVFELSAGGVHGADDVLKTMMAGARVAMI